MSAKRTTPDPAEGARRRKRPAPTIDLTATDVSAAPADHETGGMAAEPPPEEHPSPEQPEVAEPESPVSRNGKRWNWHAARQVVFAGLGGAALVTIALFGVWFAGLVPSRYAGSIEVDPASVSALDERLAKIETAIARRPPADPSISERLSAADHAMKSLGIALTALNKRNDEIAARADATEKAVTELRDGVQNLAKNTSAGLSPADVETVQKRLAALEQAVKSTMGDNAARLALTAAALRDAVIRGAPFAAELEEAKSLGADGKRLAPLAPFATGGLPPTEALAQELRALVPALVKASGVQAPSGGFLERLQANAGKLVRIRPLDAPPGDETSAVLARVEVEAAHADIDGAVADLGKLDAAARAPAQDWMKKVQARQAAVAAARQFAADATHALGKQ